jgi:hypothetical protein
VIGGENGNAEGEHACTGIAENVSVSPAIVVYVTPPLTRFPFGKNESVDPIYCVLVVLVQDVLALVNVIFVGVTAKYE